MQERFKELDAYQQENQKLAQRNYGDFLKHQIDEHKRIKDWEADEKLWQMKDLTL